MAKKSVTPSSSLSVEPRQGIQILKQLLEKGEAILSQRPVDANEVFGWTNTCREMLAKCFGSDSQNVSGFAQIYVPTAREKDDSWDRINAESLGRGLNLLRSCITQLELLSAAPPPIEMREETTGTEIFLVHGQNGGARDTVARFLEKLELPVTILHEKPDKGRTVIEKFSDYSDVGFAVVLLTADDRGGPKDRPCEEQRLRARQNVLLELGFFLGKLGRSRVCTLYEEGVEIPSDYAGVLFVPLDKNMAWRMLLAREIKAANIPIDMNKAM